MCNSLWVTLVRFLKIFKTAANNVYLFDRNNSFVDCIVYYFFDESDGLGSVCACVPPPSNCGEVSRVSFYFEHTVAYIKLLTWLHRTYEFKSLLHS